LRVFVVHTTGNCCRVSDVVELEPIAQSGKAVQNVGNLPFVELLIEEETGERLRGSTCRILDLANHGIALQSLRYPGSERLGEDAIEERVIKVNDLINDGGGHRPVLAATGS